MPAADVEAVVALSPLARRTIGGARTVEVVEVAGSAALVVAENRPADWLDPSPGGVVHRHDVRQRGAVVLDVAEREHCREVASHEQVRGRTLAAARAGACPS